MPAVINNVKDAKEFIKNKLIFAIDELLTALELGNAKFIPKHTIEEKDDKMTIVIRFEKIKSG